MGQGGQLSCPQVCVGVWVHTWHSRIELCENLTRWWMCWNAIKNFHLWIFFIQMGARTTQLVGQCYVTFRVDAMQCPGIFS